MDKRLSEISKFLSYVLRHEPEAIGLALDREGWADIDELISRAGQSGRTLDRQTIQTVVAGNDKKRFTLSDDGRHIRAVQGHSSEAVDIAYNPVHPPAILYHGTARKFLASILEKGLHAGSRQYVHLSMDAETAIKVGQRHGKPVVLEIRALDMSASGHEFFQAENGVWLTREVPTRYIVHNQQEGEAP